MKTDTQRQKDIIDELRWEPRISDREIGVAVKDGVVSLTGAVPSYSEKYVAEAVVESFSGVKAIANDLTVKLPSNSVRTASVPSSGIRANPTHTRNPTTRSPAKPTTACWSTSSSSFAIRPAGTSHG